LIAQIISLSNKDIFRIYSHKYGIKKSQYDFALGLELREISSDSYQRFSEVLNKFSKYSYQNGNTKKIFLTGFGERFLELSDSLLKAGLILESKKIKTAVEYYLSYDEKSYTISGRDFKFNKAYVMGILNVTPDSFSDGGLYLKPEDAVAHGLELLNEGADILDIGGESTRPGSKPVPADEELRRTIPVIEKILSLRPEAIISIDTTKSRVALEALKAGAKIVNDISGLTFDPEILGSVKEFKAVLILMHMKGTPQNMQINPYYDDVIEEIYNFLYKQTQKAENVGIKQIFIDPGIGFGKRLEDNLEIIKRLSDFKSIGYPIVLGASRKSFLGKILDLDVKERDESSSIVDAIAIMNGARIIRTHNVKYGADVCRILNTISAMTTTN
jgi:dihydropteroate synthase